MRRVVIGHSSEYYAKCIAKNLGNAFDTRICTDGRDMAKLLESHKPEVLILHGSMPRKDTLSILSQCPVLPRLTLITLDYINRDIQWALQSLGVRQVMLAPTAVDAAREAKSLLAQMGDENTQEDLFRLHIQLMALNFDTHLEGFRLICGAVRHLAKDPGQTLSKHVYPLVAKEHEISDQRAVEHSIRTCIEKAWLHRDPETWSRFFSPENAGKNSCPSNRKVLIALAQWVMLKDEPARDHR